MSVSFRHCATEILYGMNFKILYTDEELILESSYLTTFLRDLVGVSQISFHLFNIFIRFHCPMSYRRIFFSVTNNQVLFKFSNDSENLFPRKMLHIWVFFIQNIVHQGQRFAILIEQFYNINIEITFMIYFQIPEYLTF